MNASLLTTSFVWRHGRFSTNISAVTDPPAKE
jgi:hypothetical protein